MPTGLGAPVPGPLTYWDVKLAWSERQQGKWGNKKISSTSFSPILKTDGETSDPTMFLFKSLVDQRNNLIIKLVAFNAMQRELRVVNSALRFDGCHADPILEIGVTED